MEEQIEPSRRRLRRIVLLPLCNFLVILSACGGGGGGGQSTSAGAVDTDPPEVQLGERLFLETRFAEFFLEHSNGDVNAKLPAGDSVMDQLQTTGKPLPGPFRGQSMNCRNCHLVDELKQRSRYDVRSYSDFARRSPIPQRDGSIQTTTPRNSPTLVNATLPRDVPLVLHLDGEFATVEDLVNGTLTGPNFGWLPTESETAQAHVADVIRGDDGKNDLARSFGGGGVPYRTILLGTDGALPAHLVIPQQYRIDVNAASDAQIMEAIGGLIHAYLDSLRFSTDDGGQYNGSPYDAFLGKNNLPRSPNAGESNLAYAQRLLGLIDQLGSPLFVKPADAPASAANGKREFQLHKQRFIFGSQELQGLKVFFGQASGAGTTHSGNCVACHTPPNFSDFSFHNNGVAQVEYDGIFGQGAFAALSVPDLATRNADFDQYLPPSAIHPNASGRFRAPASADFPGDTDLGLWNVLGNPDMPAPQQPLLQILCPEFSLSGNNCSDNTLLPLIIAYFKTPTLRDLGQSNPYLHNGAQDTIEGVLNFYIDVSQLARSQQLRDSSPEISDVFIDHTDVAPLSAFLNALNEDYD